MLQAFKAHLLQSIRETQTQLNAQPLCDTLQLAEPDTSSTSNIMIAAVAEVQMRQLARLHAIMPRILLLVTVHSSSDRGADALLRYPSPRFNHSWFNVQIDPLLRWFQTSSNAEQAYGSMLQAASERQLQLASVWIACWNAAAAAADMGICISQSAAARVQGGSRGGRWEEQVVLAARCAHYAADTILISLCSIVDASLELAQALPVHNPQRITSF